MSAEWLSYMLVLGPHGAFRHREGRKGDKVSPTGGLPKSNMCHMDTYSYTASSSMLAVSI